MSLPRHILRAPFPYPGGKRRVADLVWQYLGTDAGRYVEPFAGSLGVLLGRPHVTGLEVVNDKDGQIVNVWRALKYSPRETIGCADDLRSELDLTARHLWLINEGAERLRCGLQTNPEWHDPQVAGWWLYGVALWIGEGFANGGGPWTREAIVAAEEDRKIPHLGDDGRGVHRQIPHLGDNGRGVHRQIPHLGSDGQGVHRQIPHLGDNGQGVIAPGVYELADRLAERLRRVVVVNGDWARVLSPAALRSSRGHTAVYLDPPYPGHEDAYAHHEQVWGDVVQWCERHRHLRVVLSGYDGAPGPSGFLAYPYTALGTRSVNRAREVIYVSPACAGQTALNVDVAGTGEDAP